MSDLTDEQLEWRRTHAMSTGESEFQSIVVELQRHREMVKRLEAWAQYLEGNGRRAPPPHARDRREEAARAVTLSASIDLLVWLLAEWGVRVHLHAHDLPAAGMYRSETREIFLNEPRALEALMSLAHEAGHHLGHALAPHSEQRERQAYAFGWRVLRLLGAPVTRAEWRADCRENERLRRVDGVPVTDHLYR